MRNFLKNKSSTYNKDNFKVEITDKSFYYYLLNVEDYNLILPESWGELSKQFLAAESAISEKYIDMEYDIFINNDALSAELKCLNDKIHPRLYLSNTYIIKQFSPLLRIDGCWLAGLVSLKDSPYKYGGILLQSHSLIVGNGKPYESNPFLFEQYAGSYKIKFAPIFSKTYTEDSKIEDFAFKLPVFLLSIAQFPSKLTPEILGINLFMSKVNNLIPCDKNSHSIFNEHKNNTTQILIDNAYAAIKEYLSTIDRIELIKIKSRIANGYFACYLLFKSFLTSLHQATEVAISSDLAMEVQKIFSKLAPSACGYHKKGEINNKPLDLWLDSTTFSAKEFVIAFANSKYIRPGNPEKSPFLTYLTKPNGPMFRVFSEEDLNTIKNWIIQLEDNNNLDIKELPSANKANLNIKTHSKAQIQDYLQKSLNKYEKSSLPQLYYYLLNVDLYPDIYPTAKKFVIDWLDKHKTNLFSGVCPIPFKEYSHEHLDTWLINKHREQVNSYNPLNHAPIESKKEVIHDAIQLAPLTFIDGAWIRKMALPSIVTTEIGARLYNTYVDELGNGDYQIHHGNIYRNLMNDMHINLPDFASQEFANSKCFSKDSLQVPVFWLAISIYPRTFLPEILGLNLAMELSGIGGQYRMSGDILKYYGFNPQFTMLHNTIDNIITGHTAWAIEAIKLHLDQIYQAGGHKIVQDNWHRIWTGYRSLNIPKQSYKNKLKNTFKLFKTNKHQMNIQPL